MSMFELGRTVATPAALKRCEEHSVQPLTLLRRHASGDWGDLEDEDVKANRDAVAYGDRILSAYMVGGVKLYVITEADRSSTCLLLAHEY